MNIEKLVKEDAFLQINTKQIIITFDNEISITLPMCILNWYVPLFDTILKELKECQEYKIHLHGCDKKMFENCLTVAINNNNTFFQEIKERLEDEISMKEYFDIIDTLKIYYDKFQLLGITKGCKLIEQMIYI